MPVRGDTCHFPDWATCPLLIFLHVALLSSMDGGAPDGHGGCVVPDCEVQRLDTLEEMVHDGMEGRNNLKFRSPEAWKYSEIC
jgi:hypothetical protein